MLQLVLLPSASDPDPSPKITVAGGTGATSAGLQSTLHGLKKAGSLRAVRLSMIGSDEPRKRLLDDLELSYGKYVLELAEGEREDALDECLRAEAKELGDAHSVSDDAARAHSANSVASDTVRRSESTGSRASRSTGLTSNFSDVSKDFHALSLRAKPRTSLSFRDYDAFLSRGHTNSDRKSLSFSPPSTPSQSSLSLSLTGPEDSPKRHFRRLRGLSMLKLHRTSSNNSVVAEWCPHCPQDDFSQRRAIHKLPCGHRLCTQALRSTIKAGTNGMIGAVPSCCGIPIPGRLVEHVMTHEEQSALLDRLEQWDEAASITASTRSEARSSVQARPNVLTEKRRTVSVPSTNGSLSPSSQRDLHKAMEFPEYKVLRERQEAQRDRFRLWAAKAQASLEAHHERLRTSLHRRHAQALEELADRHAADVSEAEDKQVKAEADMRFAHEQEIRDNATALKHMEAYCAGMYSTTGEPHNRTVTDQERSELEKTRRMRDGMRSKHESAINVLRGEQGRRMRMRIQRQEKEIAQQEKRHRNEELEAEEHWNNQMAEWTKVVREKRTRLVARWEMQNTSFLKKLETDTGVVLSVHLPGIEWQTDGKSASSPYQPGHAKPAAARLRTDSRLMEG